MRTSAALPVALVALVAATTATAGFQVRTYPVAGGGGRPIAMASGDMNGDGVPDIVIANLNGDSVTMLLGAKHGYFNQAPSSPFPVAPYPVSLALGDLDSDGRLDVVVACGWDDTIRVLRGDGDGGLSAAQEPGVRLKGFPVSIALGDMDRDGRLDLVVGWLNSDGDHTDVSVFVRDAAGGFRTASEVEYGNYPQHLALADLDGDGFLDVVATGFGKFLSSDDFPAYVTVLMGGTGGQLFYWHDHYIGNGYSGASLALGDVNRDGRLDVVTSIDNRLVVFLGDGTGEFSPSPRPPTPLELRISTTALADMNRDGHLDLVVGTSILLGDGVGGFGPGPDSPPVTAQGIAAVIACDLDGDGRPDVLAIDPYLDELHVLSGNGLGWLAPHAGSPYRLGIAIAALATRDVDADRRIDIVASSWSTPNGYVLRGDGAGGFTPGGSIAVDVPVGESTATGDLDGDGRPDKVALDYDGITLSAGRSDGTFEPVLSWPLQKTGLRALALADLNGDGRLDIVTGGEGSTVTVLVNDGEWGRVATSVRMFAWQYEILGETVWLWAVVSSPGGTPRGGTLVFRDGGTPVGRALELQPGLYSAIVFGDYAAPGSVHHFTAEFEGPFARPSVSETVTFVAARLGCTVELAGAPTFSTVRQPVVLSSRIACASFGAAPRDPAGSVTFLDGDVELGRSPVTGSVATLVTPALAPGIRTLTATYSGDDIHKPAQSLAIAHRVTPPACSEPDGLCLLGGRFHAVATWTSPYDGGSSGNGRSTAVTDATGAFWFFSPESLEVMLKIVDGRAINGRFWVALGALADVGYSVVVTDRLTGNVRTYSNPPAYLGSLLDTQAFGDGPSRPETAFRTESRGPTAAGLPTALVSSTASAVASSCHSGTLCLQDQFGVYAWWRKRAGGRAVGSGHAIPLTPESGAFRLASPDDVDLVVKILDGRAVNGKWWVFYTGLRDDLYVDFYILHPTGYRPYSSAPGKVPVGIDITAF